MKENFFSRCYNYKISGPLYGILFNERASYDNYKYFSSQIAVRENWMGKTTKEILKDYNGKIVYEKEYNGIPKARFFYAECLDYICKRDLHITPELIDRYTEYFPPLPTSSLRVDNYEVGEPLNESNFSISIRLVWNNFMGADREETYKKLSQYAFVINDFRWTSYDFIITKNSAWIQMDELGFPKVYESANPKEFLDAFCLLGVFNFFFKRYIDYIYQ